MTARRRAPGVAPVLPTSVGVQTVAIRDRGADRPPLTVANPRGGWTLDAVEAAAVAYGNEHADLGDARRLSRVAYRDLLASLPSSLKRAEVHERLRGRYRLGPFPVDRHVVTELTVDAESFPF